ncbi:MAG: DUF2750 domain-containing protein [Bacteroidota bacterium]
MREDWLEHIKAMSPADQYKYFLNRVAEFEVLWGLYDEKNNGWAMTVSDENKERIALWPEPEMARLNAQDVWKKYRTETLDLYGFLEHGIEVLETADRGVSIMYIPDHGGLEVELPYLARDLREAIHVEEEQSNSSD